MIRYLLPVGIGLIFLGIIFIIISSLSGEKGDTKVAVGGIIGFIPFGFGNDKRLMWFAMILTALIFWVLVYLWK